jgi:hypothetical protein
MTPLVGCGYRHEVERAARTRRWTPELDAHARACTRCSPTWVVAHALHTPLKPAPAAADPATLWAAARQVRRIVVEARISWIVTTAQVVTLALICAVLVTSIPWPAVWSWIGHPATGTGADGTWLTGAGALVIAATFVLGRWLSRDA